MNGNPLKSRLFATSMFASAAFALGGVAYAQDATVDAPAEEEEARQEVVQITGSRIGQTNLNSPVPVSQFSAAEIDLTGAVNVSEILRTLPAAGVSGITSTNSNFSTTASGINTVDLRNLGEDRTLVLVNGRRFVAGLPGTQIVDFNQIPTDFIERIDVITGGASAVYGSDALAGVVNIILKDDFEGVSFSAQHGLSEAEDLESYEATMTAGSNFADGRGNAIASLTWSRNNGAFFSNREGQGVDDISLAAFGGSFATSDNVLVTFSDFVGSPFFSSFSEFGRFDTNQTSTNADDFTFVDGQTVPWVTSEFGFNRQAFRALRLPEERITASSVIDYEITPWANFFTEITYATTDTRAELEPFPLSSEDIYGGGIECGDLDNNPATPDVCANGAPATGGFVPADFLAELQAANPTVALEDLRFGFVRRTTEVNQRTASNTRQTARIVTGFDGSFDNGISYEASLNWGRTTQSQESTGGIDVRAFEAALDTTVIDGELVCADPIQRNLGCVPINIFGIGSITPDAAAWVRADSKFDAEIEQVVFNAFLTGDSTVAGFELPAGPLSWVVGYEWREESSSSIPDALSQSGLNGGNVTPITVGGFDVWEVFGELELPLLKDQQFAEELSLNLAARYSDYSTVGETFAWAANAEYQPISQLRFRANYAEAVRAPNIGELFAGLGETFATVADPCNNIVNVGGNFGFGDGMGGLSTDADDIRIASVCLADPNIAARIARDGEFVLTQPELQGTGGFVGGAFAGGFELKEEESTSFTFGFIFNPDYNKWLEPLAFSIDYFDYEITDAIATIGRQTSFSRCYGLGDDTVTTFDPNSPFCVNVDRFATGPSIGAAEGVNSFQQNIAVIQTSGIDAQVSYSWDINDSFSSVSYDLGTLAGSFNYQWLEAYEQQSLPGDEFGDFVGEQGLSEHEGLLGVVYDRGPLTIAVDTTWIGETSTTYGGLLPSDDPFEIDNIFFTDAQIRYRFLDDQITLLAGVDNIADEFVPTGVGLAGGVGQYTNDAVYDALGRRFYAGFRLDF